MESSKRIVEEIDDGRIVRVSEEYAIREGLPILRRKELSFLGNNDKKESKEELRKEMRAAGGFDTFRRPLRQKSDVASTLVDNFHWVLSAKRKGLNITRKYLADRLGVKELDIKMIENGVLPSEDYILINKLEQFLGVVVRKDGVSAPVTLNSLSGSKAVQKPLEKKATYHLRDYRQILKEKEKEKFEKSFKLQESLVGKDIEIDLDETN